MFNKTSVEPYICLFSFSPVLAKPLAKNKQYVHADMYNTPYQRSLYTSTGRILHILLWGYKFARFEKSQNKRQ